MKQSHIIIGLVVIALIAVAIFMSGNKGGDGDGANTPVPTTAALDDVLDFYNAWLDMRQGVDGAVSQEELLARSIVGAEVRVEIETALAEALEDAPDPVLCQVAVPSKIAAKAIFEQERDAQFLVISRDKEVGSARSAEVTVTAVDGMWQITSIGCSNGESAPEREFNFIREGFLLKSVPEPLNSDYWHLVYEQNGVQGNTVPLFFSTETICIEKDASEAVCVPDSFVEPSYATVYGSLTEAGLNVEKVEF